jgi:dTDP-4-dehydrorhamnose reductase
MDLKNKKILVTGANGQLGSAIVTIFKQHNMNVVGTDRSIMDITNQKQVFEVINQIKPQVIIHCAAYTAVDKAEEDKLNCYKVNVEGTRNLALISKELKIELIYFSTDYVFDGTKPEPYEVNDSPNPINYYGLTKYLGEEIIKSLLTNFYIFRISWVFGPNGKNFVNTILRLASEKSPINVVNDQIGSPTFTIDVATFLLSKVNLNYGIHHLTNEGYISWYEFASKIVKILNLKCTINPIQSVSYKTLAKRGLNSRLAKFKYCTLNFWEQSLYQYLVNFDTSMLLKGKNT